MALIQKIRSKSWLLLVLIGLAMLLFVVDPSSINPRSSRNTKIADVNGQDIEYNTYVSKLNEIEEFNKIQRGVNSLEEKVLAPIRHQALEELVQESILKTEFKKIGLSVHGDELFDMVQGKNIHPIIGQIFANPETGAVNRAQLYNFLQAIAQDEGSQQKAYWLYLEKAIYKSRLNEKYNTLISKGLYATNLEAKQKKAENTATVDFLFTVKPYSAVSDSSVKFSDSDLRKYYETHKESYKTPEVREIRYVAFDVIPSKDDFADADKWINDVKDELATIPVKEAPQYVNYNSDNKYDNTNYAKGELPDSIEMFAFNAELGDIYGPFFENNAFKLAMLTSKKMISDSVKIRHILMPINEQNYQQVIDLGDSLLKEINAGANFTAIAREHSQDRQSAAMGGDLGWMKEKDVASNFGAAFKDSCFENRTGHAFMNVSQYGVQIVEISNQSAKVEKVQLGVITHAVTPGTETDQHYYSMANEFAGKHNTKESFDKAIAEQNMKVNVGRNITPSTQSIPNLDGSRKIVRWAYDAKKGDISTVFQMNDKYVIAVLDKVSEGGYQSLEDLKESLKLAVTREKKAEIISTELANAATSASSIDEIASTVGSSVKTASSIRFRTNYLPEAGEEKDVIGAAFAANEGLLTTPIDGRNGVYIISVEQKTEANTEGDLSYEKRSIASMNGSRVNYTVSNVLKDLSGVKDYRTKFF